METLLYLLKMTFCFSCFYLAWLLIFRKSSFYQIHRIYLLCCMPASILLPLIRLPERSILITSRALPEMVIRFSGAVDNHNQHTVSTIDLILLVYAITASLLLFISALNFYKMVCLLKKASYDEKLGVKVIENAPIQGIASFINTVFIGARKQQTLHPMIIQHEKVHIDQYHWLDLAVAQIFFCLNWFNPLNVLFYRSLKEQHEYFADQILCRNSDDKPLYQELLVTEALGSHTNISVHAFSRPSLLRTRLIKMNEKVSKRTNLFLYMMGIPLLFSVAFICFSFTKQTLAAGADYAHGLKHLPIFTSLSHDNSIDRKAYSMLDTARVYVQVDRQPVYPGGESALLSDLSFYLSSHYPPEAKRHNISGRVSVNFIVEEDGSLSHIHTIRGRDLGYGLADTAENATRHLKRFKPGILGGKAARVSYSVPILFSPSDSKPSKKLIGKTVHPAPDSGKLMIVHFVFPKSKSAVTVYQDCTFARPDDGVSIPSAQTTSFTLRTVPKRQNSSSLAQDSSITISMFNKISKKYLVNGVEMNQDDFKKIKPNEIISIRFDNDLESLKKYGLKPPGAILEVTTKLAANQNH